MYTAPAPLLHPAPRGSAMLPPLCGLNNAPVDAECVSQVKPEATSLDDAEAAALGPCEAELARWGHGLRATPISSAPRPSLCRSIARHWAGVSSGTLPALRPLVEVLHSLRGRKDSAPSFPCAHLGLEKRSDSSRSHGSRPEVRASGAQAVTPQRVDWIRGTFPPAALTHRQSCLHSTQQI